MLRQTGWCHFTEKLILSVEHSELWTLLPRDITARPNPSVLPALWTTWNSLHLWGSFPQITADFSLLNAPQGWFFLKSRGYDIKSHHWCWQMWQTHSSTRTTLPGLMWGCKDKTKGCPFKRGYNSQWKAKQKQLEGFSELLEALTHIHCKMI